MLEFSCLVARVFHLDDMYTKRAEKMAKNTFSGFCFVECLLCCLKIHVLFPAKHYE